MYTLECSAQLMAKHPTEAYFCCTCPMTQLKNHSIEKLPMKTALKNHPSDQHCSLYIHPVLLSLIIFNVDLLCLHACDCVRAMAHTGVSEANLGVFLSTLWVPGTELRSSDLAAGALTQWRHLSGLGPSVSRRTESSLQQTNKQTNTWFTLAAIWVFAFQRQPSLSPSPLKGHKSLPSKGIPHEGCLKWD